MNHPHGPIRACSALLALIALVAAPSRVPAVEIQHFETPDGIAYGTWGTTASRPAPTLIVLAGDIDGTLGNAYFRQCGNQLAEDGWLCVSIDLPCHGRESRNGEPSGLSGWSHRANRQENFVADNNARLASVLDHVIKTGQTDPQRIAACGTSRGGFLAIHFAAYDSRVRCAAGFAPVTDLSALSEFKAIEDKPFVAQLSLSAQADKLAGRPVWIVIGDQDERVGTDRAIEFCSRLTAATRSQQLDSQAELHVLPEPRGHTTPSGSGERAAEWVRQIFAHVVAPAEGQQQLSLPSTAGESNSQIDNNDHAGAPRNLLLIDDHHILYRAGTERVFHPATLNASNPVIREDQPWEMAIGWTSVVRHPDTGRYQLWYQAYAGGRDARKSHKCVVCYAESDDGLTFIKPPLPMHNFSTERAPFAGNYAQTNIVLVGEGGYGDRYANSVLFDPRDPEPAKRFKMLYTDFGVDDEEQEWPGVFAAFSPDGIHWTKSPANPLIRTAYGGRGWQPPFSDETPYDERWDERKNFLRKNWPIPLSMSDAIDVMFDPLRGVYVAYGKCWLQAPDGGLAWKHAMARIESDDFLTWSKPRIVASPDDRDDPDTEFHTSPVFFHTGVYFCLNQILSARGEAIGAKADAMHVELMISRDGLHWQRPFRDTKFIDGSQQAFANGGIFTNSTPIILEDEIRFYFGGYNSGAIGGGTKLTDPSQQSGVGVASIPLDRFAGIRPLERSAQSTLKRPLEHVGQVTLKPRHLSGVGEITLNADATDGSVRVELLDEDGYRIRGYAKDDAVEITGDSLRHRVEWDMSGLDALPPGRYMLRLHLEQAEVFAIRLE
jgi:dienelactone hydrolase